jgi:hypothetical protein
MNRNDVISMGMQMPTQPGSLRWIQAPACVLEHVSVCVLEQVPAEWGAEDPIAHAHVLNYEYGLGLPDPATHTASYPQP